MACCLTFSPVWLQLGSIHAGNLHRLHDQVVCRWSVRLKSNCFWSVTCCMIFESHNYSRKVTEPISSARSRTSAYADRYFMCWWQCAQMQTAPSRQFSSATGNSCWPMWTLVAASHCLVFRHVRLCNLSLAGVHVPLRGSFNSGLTLNFPIQMCTCKTKKCFYKTITGLNWKEFEAFEKESSIVVNLRNTIFV